MEKIIIVIMVSALLSGSFWNDLSEYQKSPINSQYVQTGFTWEMPNRYGLDENANNIIDLRNTYSYTNPSIQNGVPRFKVKFTAQLGSSQFNVQNLVRRRSFSFQWEIVGLNILSTSSNPIWEVELAEGVYNVRLIVSRRSRRSQVRDTIVQQVPVEDILIVSMGDSFSSGEGNPERHRLQYRANNLLGNQGSAVWADDGTSTGRGNRAKNHRRSHRSTLSWPSQAALKIEQLDDLNSVSFISVAASGATIRSGLIGPYRGVDNEPLSQSMSPMPSQVDQVKAIVGNRTVDALTISIGVNDLGFAEVISEYVTRIWKDDPPNMGTLLNQLEANFDDLKQALDALNIRNVYLAEYPDPTGRIINGELYYCEEVVGDILGGFKIDSDEQEDLVKNFLNPLNARLEKVARKYGWIYLGGISEDFINGHGYCSGYPVYRYDYSGYYFYEGNPYPLANPIWPTDRETSWFRTASQASVLQGPLHSGVISATNIYSRVKNLMTTKGTLHPNELGHLAVRDRFLDFFSMPVDIDGLHEMDTDDQISEAVFLQDFSHIGAILRGVDVDMFKIKVSNKESLKIVARNYLVQPTLQPIIRLFNKRGTELKKSTPGIKTNTDTRTNQTISWLDYHEALLEYKFDRAGDYFIAISAKTNESYNPISGHGDYLSQASYGPYILHIQHIDGEPDNTLASANILKVGRTAGFSIEHEKDVDIFKFKAPASKKYKIKVETNLFYKPVRNSSSPVIPPRGRTSPAPNLTLNTNASISRALKSDLAPRIVIFNAQGQEVKRGTITLESDFIKNRTYYVGISSDDILGYQPSTGIVQFKPLRSTNIQSRINRNARNNSNTQLSGITNTLHASVSTGKYTIVVGVSGK